MIHLHRNMTITPGNAPEIVAQIASIVRKMKIAIVLLSPGNVLTQEILESFSDEHLKLICDNRIAERDLIKRGSRLPGRV